MGIGATDTKLKTMEKHLHFLQNLLYPQISETSKDWIEQKIEQLQSNFKEHSFYMSFSATSRFFGHIPLQVSEEDAKKAHQLVNGFSPQALSQNQVARALLLLSIAHLPEKEFKNIYYKLKDTAEMYEAAALFAALPLLPYPESLLEAAIDGVRTNITLVFDAIALQNPYPAQYFPEAAWNQLYLKAAFMARPIQDIIGIEKRANQELANILSDFAHERWAAGREVPLNMWLTVPQFVNEGILEDLKKLFSHTESEQQAVAALVCSKSADPKAKALLEQYPQWKEKIDKQQLSWEELLKA